MTQLQNAFDVLQERGYIAQMSHPEEIREHLAQAPRVFYTGYDPTADSLHVGHFVQLMAMSHMQKAGHKPIVLVGGGTCMIGDPSGKTDMRKMMSREMIADNANKMKTQMEKFLDFSPGNAIMVDNADWLLDLNYIDFLRDIGVHFSVNRMLAADAYKNRLESGLTFFEFNYMLMQSYDYLKLYRDHNCTLQLGGDDQWSNILAGADLIRRKEKGEAFAMTFALLAMADGTKMGKTVSGALWLDAEKTSPYEFYQYWRNIEDASVEKCLALLTYLPMEEVKRLGALEGSEINKAKKVLAFEVTNLIHGPEEAKKAEEASEALFEDKGTLENIPSTEMTAAEYEEAGDRVLDIMTYVGISKSKSEARRLIEGGGVMVDDVPISDVFATLSKEQLQQGVIIQRGKKVHHRVTIV